MPKILKIGSRSSLLATIQVKEVMSLLGGDYSVTPITFKTKGDIDKSTSLMTSPSDDFFTDTLDKALLDGQIDVAVHSAKDLPKHMHPGLEIFALTETLDNTDAWVSGHAWNDVPKGGRVGTSSLMRKNEILNLRPDLTIVDIRGSVQERIALIEQGKIDGLIVATCALKRLGLSAAIRDIFPWEATPLQGQLAVVGRAGDKESKKLWQSIDVRQTYGRVFLVGAGPGDPDLITVKAIKALSRADCVLYDYLADKSLLKYAPLAEHIYAGKRKGDHTLPQQELSRMLKVKAMQGKTVVRLKGGDPLVFGRGGDEILYLNAYHIDVQIIPGVSSATGIPSQLGVPLTARGVSSSVAFVSAHDEDERYHADKPVRIPDAQTLVFLMGLSKLSSILDALRQAKWVESTPVLIVSKGTRVDQTIVNGTIATIGAQVAASHIQPPALIVVGNTVQFYKDHAQKTFIHCGTNPQIYQNLGRIISLPMIDLAPITFDGEERDRFLNDFQSADMVMITSPSAALHFMKLILGYMPLSDVKAKPFAVIGKHSGSVLQRCGIVPQITASEETAKGLFETLKNLAVLHSKKIFFPRSALPNPFLSEALTAEGAEVAEWAVYTNTKPPKRDLPQIPIDGIIFTSPSTVHHFIDDYKTIPAEWTIIAKGPVTRAALKAAGYACEVIE